MAISYPYEITLYNNYITMYRLMWEKTIIHKPPMTGNGKYTTYLWCFGGWLIIVSTTLYNILIMQHYITLYNRI
jgi:hypothetical protein